MRILFLTAIAGFIWMIFSALSPAVNPVTANKESSVCVSAEEQMLYRQIMEYRRANNLPQIQLSASMTRVAQLHAKDLSENRPFNSRCNLHSWSKKGKWSSCCYTNNHRESECMWKKPQELTNYPGYGYEIAIGYEGKTYNSRNKVSAASAFSGWKSSSGHNALLLNKSIWKDVKWEAIGIAIYRDMAVVWFGEEPDPDGEAKRCK